MKKITLSTMAVLGITAAATAGGDATFTLITPGTVADMTPDGQFIAGTTSSGTGFIWSEAGGVVLVPGGDVVAISNDGATLLGEIEDPKTGKNIAGLWTEGTGWVGLGGFEGETGCDANLSNPYELSGDASIAVGLGWVGCTGNAFRYTADTGMVPLPEIDPRTRANAISNDGAIIGGWDDGPTGSRRAKIWTGWDQILPLVGIDGNPEGIGEVMGFNTTGSVAVGSAHRDLATGGGFRVMDGVVDIIPFLPGTDPVFNFAGGFGVSDNGSRVVGTNISGFGPFAPREATLWTPDDGVRALRDVLSEDYGVEVPVEFEMTSADAISADGTIIAGYVREGLSPTVFVVTLPSKDCPGDLDGGGSVDFQDILFILSNWGPCP